MLKISDSDWAFKVLPSFTYDNEEFASMFWNLCIDKALGMYGLRLRDKQMDDGFYRLTVIDPTKWMLAVLKFEFETN
jgi:hypothetical protein